MKRYGLILAGMLSALQGLARQPAFPGAEGGGANTVGGRGGKVYTVSSLRDAGPGSLREALEARGARTIVFAVSGTIDLKSKLIVENDSVTVAGQSAPGDGICLKGFPLYIRANQVIIRYLRCRLGDSNKLEDDALGAMNVHDLIIDHCSVSWSVDECLSVYKSRNISVQWCMISQSLAKSVHTKGAHGFGGIWGGENASFHHNYIADNTSRNPRFASDGFSPVDFRNNVIFNWGFKSAYGGGRHGRINMVNNYFKPGPATDSISRGILLDPAEDGTGTYYLSGNYLFGNPAVTDSNWRGVSSTHAFVRAEMPFATGRVNTAAAQVIYKVVLEKAGCSLRRDNYDKAIVAQFFYKDKLPEAASGNLRNGIIDTQSEVYGWPSLRSLEYETDSDGDGMPDSWEKKNGLNPGDPSDGSRGAGKSHYTSLEIYLNSLVADHEYYSVRIPRSQASPSVFADTLMSPLAKRLRPLGRILDSPDYYVWCCAPVYGKDGRVHVFYSRWLKKYGMGGWLSKSEIAHAVADQPEGPYRVVGTILKPRAGSFDATSCHNPHIQFLNGKYYLFYMGTSDGTVNTKRIGLATASSPDGPWTRSPAPLLQPGQQGAWDDCCTSNPAFIMVNGSCRLYYKSWNTAEYAAGRGPVKGNRKYGLALTDNIYGPYRRYKDNPVIDLSALGDNKQVEDGFIFKDGEQFCMLMRDMGYFDETVGLLFTSADGLRWSRPSIAWLGMSAYLAESVPPSHLKRYGRFERPQLLMKEGKPAYLFTAAQGGRYGTATGFVFKIEQQLPDDTAAKDVWSGI